MYHKFSNIWGCLSVKWFGNLLNLWMNTNYSDYAAVYL